MPVHARDRKEAGGPQGREEMELEFGEPDGSSGSEEEEDEEDESPGSSGSDGGESEEMDDEDCERRRMECLNEMSNLEKQFTDLKDQNEPLTQSALVGGHHRRQSSRTLWTNGDRRKRERLYKERLNQVDYKLQEVSSGKGPEYLEPLATLQDNMQIRTKVAGIYRELCLESVKNKYDCEIQAARQHCESEKLLLFDTVQSELEEKIRRLEEDRHSIDITSELWNDEIQSRKKRKDPFSPDKKKKPMVVSVYMLQDLDILEDWTSIRKAMATLGPHRVKPEGFMVVSTNMPCADFAQPLTASLFYRPLFSLWCHSRLKSMFLKFRKLTLQYMKFLPNSVPVKMDKLPHCARSEEGRLHYDGEWYGRGHAICIDKKDEYPTSAIITTIHHDEVWFKRQDGSKSKLYISQLQKGKYTIKHM